MKSLDGSGAGLKEVSIEVDDVYMEQHVYLNGQLQKGAVEEEAYESQMK